MNKDELKNNLRDRTCNNCHHCMYGVCHRFADTEGIVAVAKELTCEYWQKPEQTISTMRQALNNFHEQAEREIIEQLDRYFTDERLNTKE